LAGAVKNDAEFGSELPEHLRTCDRRGIENDLPEFSPLPSSSDAGVEAIDRWRLKSLDLAAYDDLALSTRLSDAGAVRAKCRGKDFQVVDDENRRILDCSGVHGRESGSGSGGYEAEYEDADRDGHP
jgi:hypothetical protein